MTKARLINVVCMPEYVYNNCTRTRTRTRTEHRKILLRLYTALHTMTVLVCICSAETNSMGPGSAKKGEGLGKVMCGTCPHKAKWGKMLSWKVFEGEKPIDDWEDDPKQPFHFAYMCHACVKIEGGHETDVLAWEHIFAMNGTAKYKRARVAKFNHSKKVISHSFEAMHVSKSKHALYQLTRNSVKTVFEDIIDLIQLKVRSLELLASSVVKHAALREELAGTTNIERIKEIVDAIADENEKDHAMLAFKDNVTGKTDWGMWKASTYHDQYVQTTHGYMRYWFVCMAGGNEYTCMTAILSKLWDRKFPDPTAVRNKWRCTFCNSNYKATWGVFVELRIGDKIYCLRASVPDDDTLDIKAMDLERQFKNNASTPQELYDAIPMIAPTTTQYVVCLDEAKGQYKLIGKKEYLLLPEWKWKDVLQMAFPEVAK
jgi:hypothetical protein